MTAREPDANDPLRLPDETEVEALLTRLGLSAADQRAVRAARPDPDDVELRRLLGRCVRQLVRGIGGMGTIDDWPALPAEPGSRERLLYVWVFVAAVPYVRRFHADHGISEEATFDVLRELGAQMDNHRAMFGTAGLHTHGWMTVHFRGALYRIGRLLYERLRLPYAISAGDWTAPAGTYALGVHIPRGPLTPECDDSLRRARGFFRRHFPDEPYELATCTSWVLDDQLASFLATDTNIIRFQRRFRPIVREHDRPADDSTVEAIFRRPWTGIDVVSDLPRTTTLERGIAAHLRAGGHWYFRTGWLPLP